jgi:hypothetical protein
VKSVVSQQVGQANVNGTKLRALRVPVPPLDEQQRIVAEIEKQFTRLEAAVASLKRVQAALKRYRASVLKAACEGPLVPTEVAWKQTTLGEVSSVLAGYGFPECLQGRSAGDIASSKLAIFRKHGSATKRSSLNRTTTSARRTWLNSAQKCSNGNGRVCKDWRCDCPEPAGNYRRAIACG